MSYLYQFLGWILEGIDWVVFHTLGIHNVGICIILFTFIVYLIMFPLNAKQQKSSRLMTKINPEILAIQEKYKGKKDNESMMRQQAETQEIYNKYGVSPFGGCLPLIISMPIIFALYGVIREVTKYAPSLEGATGFLGLDLSQTPTQYASTTKWAYMIPVLAVVFQFLNSQILQAKSKNEKGKKNKNTQQDSMQQSMKMMNYFMPLMSGFFALSFSMGIGLYWIAASIFRIGQTIIINRQVDKISLDDLVEKNKEKAAKKSKKRKQMNEQMEMYAKQRTSSIKTAAGYQNKETADKNDVKKPSYNTTNTNYEKGSIGSYAHMLDGDKEKDK
mgnify:FL=1